MVKRIATANMAIVTVKSKYQVVIPRAKREKLGISRGDVLEAKVERGRVTYTPKAVIHRVPVGKAERASFLKRLSEEAPACLKETWVSSKRQGTDKFTMRQINKEIATARRPRKPKPAR